MRTWEYCRFACYMEGNIGNKTQQLPSWDLYISAIFKLQKLLNNNISSNNSGRGRTYLYYMRVNTIAVFFLSNSQLRIRNPLRNLYILRILLLEQFSELFVVLNGFRVCNKYPCHLCSLWRITFDKWSLSHTSCLLCKSICFADLLKYLVLCELL